MLRKYVPFLSVVIVYLIITCTLGCSKEYSFEGSSVFNNIPRIDSAQLPAPSTHLLFCDKCQDGNSSDTTYWNFLFEGKRLCGPVTKAIMTPEKNRFTFFGPTLCSVDTGLVMSVFLEDEFLNRDLSNIQSMSVALEYYDNTTLSNILTSVRSGISFNIDTYSASTRTAKGSFSGSVKMKDSSIVSLTSGNFVIKFQ
ncbi:MAG: hypothetical protein ABIR19_11035 [Ginsengibacter sp.]